MNTDEIFTRNEQQASVNVHLNFSKRQQDIFEHLDRAQEKMKNNICSAETSMDLDEPVLTTNKRKRSEMKQFRGKESIFKRPELPLSKCLPLRSAPDFKRNPHKWMKYSLDDVRYEDMSEQSNTNAALSFLRELEERKTPDITEVCESNDKIIFKPRKQLTFNKSAALVSQLEESSGESSEEKGVFKGSKVVMPEYVIGKKNKKNQQSKTTTGKPKENIKEIKLDHLLETDED